MPVKIKKLKIKKLKKKIPVEADKPVKKSGRGSHFKGKLAEFDSKIIHKITREVYIDGLVRGGTARSNIPNSVMTDEKIDKYCSFCSPHVRATIRACIAMGLIDESKVK